MISENSCRIAPPIPTVPKPKLSSSQWSDDWEDKPALELLKQEKDLGEEEEKDWSDYLAEEDEDGEDDGNWSDYWKDEEVIKEEKKDDDWSDWEDDKKEKEVLKEKKDDEWSDWEDEKKEKEVLKEKKDEKKELTISIHEESPRERQHRIDTFICNIPDTSFLANSLINLIFGFSVCSIHGNRKYQTEKNVYSTRSRGNRLFGRG